MTSKYSRCIKLLESTHMVGSFSIPFRPILSGGAYGSVAWLFSGGLWQITYPSFFAGFPNIGNLVQLFCSPLMGGCLFYCHGSLRIQLPSPGLRFPLAPGFVCWMFIPPVFWLGYRFSIVLSFLYFQSHKVCCQIKSKLVYSV